MQLSRAVTHVEMRFLVMPLQLSHPRSCKLFLIHALVNKLQTSLVHHLSQCSIAVMWHHDHANSYERKHLIGLLTFSEA